MNLLGAPQACMAFQDSKTSGLPFQRSIGSELISLTPSSFKPLEKSKAAQCDAYMCYLV